MKRAIQITVVLGAAVAAALALAAAVYSHAGYDSSEPGRNEIVPEAPERVDVFFKQDVVKREGAFHVRVFDETQAQVSDGDGAVNDDDRSHVYAELPAGLGPGRYVVEWMTTSDTDGDTDDGAFCFYVGVDPTAEQQAECAVFDEEVPPTPTRRPTEEPAQPTDPGSDPTPTVVAPSDGADDDESSNTVLVIGIVVAVVVTVAIVIGGLAWASRRE